MAISAEVLRQLIADVLEEPLLPLLRGEAGLAWQEEPLRASLSALTNSLAGIPSETEVRQAREAVGAADDDHDAWHRFAYRLFAAFEAYPEADKASLAADAKRVLYPEGLNAITASYRREVAATETFAQRLDRTDVESGLSVLRDAGLDIDAILGKAIGAGRALGEALSRQDRATAASEAVERQAALFAARNEAASRWSLFMSTVPAVFDASTEEGRQNIGLFLVPWREVRRLAYERGDTGTVGALDALAPSVPSEVLEADSPAPS